MLKGNIYMSSPSIFLILKIIIFVLFLFCLIFFCFYFHVSNTCLKKE